MVGITALILRIHLSSATNMGKRRRNHVRFILLVFLLVSLFFVSKSKSTLYDLFSSEGTFDNMPHDTLHFKVNGQDMDLLVRNQNDYGALLSKVRNNKSLPFYRDKNGGLSVHVHGGIDKDRLSSPGALMSMIEPFMGFVNGHSTKYVSLRLDKGFDASGFLDTAVRDSEDLPVYPSAEKINILQTKQFCLGHYKAQATASAVLVYYDSRLKSQGYKKLREANGMALYQSAMRLMIVNVEEQADYVSIITYTVKNK